jgi:hypothetical protein
VQGAIKVISAGRTAVAIRCVFNGERAVLTVNARDSLAPVSRTPQGPEEHVGACGDDAFNETKEHNVDYTRDKKPDEPKKV